ncbi:MAG: hypothetical protein Kow0025_21980 [Thermodesulfovibrionales bacterium]
MKARHLALAAVALALAGYAGWYYLTAPDGGELFRKMGCIRCHVFRGVGEGDIDISSVSRKWSRARIMEHIRDPARTDPDIAMPSFAFLSDRELRALAEYLSSPQPPPRRRNPAPARP